MSYRSHDGHRPIRFLFDLNSPLRQELWQAWALADTHQSVAFALAKTRDCLVVGSW